VLLLVRHGRTAENASRRLLGRLDVPLDDLGRRQAEALGRHPRLHAAPRVISSPLQRAVETASALGPPVEVDDRWTELDYGKFDGMSVEAAADLWRLWGRDLHLAPEGGESLAEMGKRVRAACEDVWPEAAEQDVVVVTHVSPIKAAVAWALGVGDEISWRMFVDVASVSYIGTGRSGPALHRFNETHGRPSD
jgi:broad specificity phosphatase PhoE